MRQIVTGSDEELIKRCAKGDHAAFDILFKKYARPLTYFITQIIHDNESAQDIFQDTFFKVLKHVENYDDRFRFTTWIYRIALNLSINELRKKRRDSSRFLSLSAYDSPDKSLDILDLPEGDETPYDLVERKDMLDRVSKALDHLSGSKRVTFILKFFHNLSYEEIAAIIGCSLGTVKSRIHYAVEQLQILAGE